VAAGGGNVYVTGYSHSGESLDYTTIAYSSAGAALWTNFYGGPGSWGDYPQALAVGGSGNVFVTGYSSDNGQDDYATLAYSSAGVPLWTNRYNGPVNGPDVATAVAVDGTGNVFVTGFSSTETNGNDFVTIKYSGVGAPLWTNRYDGPANSDDNAVAMAVDGSGNVFVTGYSYGSDSSRDYATIAYSGTGVALWTNRYNGPGNGDDQAQALAVDGNSRVYVTGYSQGSGNSDYTTIAYSSAGVALWTNRYNGSGNDDDRAQAVVIDSSGRIFVTGDSRGSGNNDEFATIAYSSAGVALWTNRYNAPFNGDDQPLGSRSMAVVGDGSVVVVGRSDGSYTGSSAYDYATVKYVTVPALTITRPSANTAKISWPFPSTDFNLRQNTNLNTTNWISPSETVSNDGTNKFITVSPPTGNRFYRLIYP
jgi:hypothetical protein